VHVLGTLTPVSDWTYLREEVTPVRAAGMARIGAFVSLPSRRRLS